MEGKDRGLAPFFPLLVFFSLIKNRQTLATPPFYVVNIFYSKKYYTCICWLRVLYTAPYPAATSRPVIFRTSSISSRDSTISNTLSLFSIDTVREKAALSRYFPLISSGVSGVL